MEEPDTGPAVSLNRTIFDGIIGGEHWRKEVCEKNGLKPDVLRIGYTPNDVGCKAIEHKRTQYQIGIGVTPPGFDPQCVGKPLLWVDDATGTPHAGYKIQ